MEQAGWASMPGTGSSRGRGQAFQAVWVKPLGLMTVLHGICCMFGGLMASILSRYSDSNMDVKKSPSRSKHLLYTSCCYWARRVDKTGNLAVPMGISWNPAASRVDLVSSGLTWTLALLLETLTPWAC